MTQVHSPDVILIAGPAGAGKTSLGKRIATEPGWTHISEDRIWDELELPTHAGRSAEDKEEKVQPRAIELIKAALENGEKVAFEFIVYETPPQPIIRYQNELTSLGIEFATRVIRPSVEQILQRKFNRGDTGPAEHDRKNAERQVACLSSSYIRPEWVVDSTDTSLDETFERHFRELVEK